jgi:hypothetical protein
MSNTVDLNRGRRSQNRVGDAPADQSSSQSANDLVGGDEGRGRLASNPSDIPARGLTDWLLRIGRWPVLVVIVALAIAVL